MKITKARYEAAKKKLLDVQKFRKIVEDWENAVRNCSYKEEVTAVTIKDGSVKLESETIFNGKSNPVRTGSS